MAAPLKGPELDCADTAVERPLPRKKLNRGKKNLVEDSIALSLVNNL